ncbi:hypothetical protein EPK99_25020 [Neorhizobium lilium]|uniref:Uncharacterized protein n=1 Tax=Neorhizobium lilium TaxID=2503024 RepID=A0A444LA52_9HYPH|nr:hypothetical protein [Neorhizobium lilium]RWX74449.1 hypothetical protein EPK99_25020 [Neorhizobium lilium]
MKQLDLFKWAENRPTNVIPAQARFQDRAIAFVRQVMASGEMPAPIDGKVIEHEFRPERNVA